jgi:hypothetical protein
MTHMAVTKALRYQILRRDGFRCHYCGATAEQSKLRVDHVIPEALGGPTEPGNLVTACHDCNAGKAATPPDAASVATLDERNVEWATALEQAKANASAKWEKRRDNAMEFKALWDDWKDPDGRPMPLPDDYPDALETWLRRGLTKADLRELVHVAMAKKNLPNVATFRYFAGCCRRRLTELETEASRLLNERQAATGED